MLCGSTYGCEESIRHSGVLSTCNWGLSRQVDLCFTRNPSLDYKWLKSLHHNVLAGCINFLKSFTTIFGRKETFLKIRQAWDSSLVHETPRLELLFCSICRVKLCAEKGLSTDLFKEGVQHPAHTSTMLLSQIYPIFWCAAEPKNGLWLNVPFLHAAGWAQEAQWEP